MAIQPGWSGQWETLANAITSYYGGGVQSAQYQQVINMLNSGNYTMEEMEAILGGIPEFSRTYNSAGQLTNVSYTANVNAATSAAGSVAQQVNSNVANSTATQFSTVQNITKNAQTGKVAINDSVAKYSSGTAGTAKVVATNAISAIAATAVGINLGKRIDQRLYNSNPDFWDSIGMSSLNPQTWSSITAGENTLGATLFNFVLGIEPQTNNPQLYLNQDVFAYMAAYMGSMGVFSEGQQEADYDDSGLPTNQQSLVDLPFEILNPSSFSYTRPSAGLTFSYTSSGSTKFVTYTQNGSTFLLATAKNRSDSFTRYMNGSPLAPITFENAPDYTFNGETVYHILSSLTSEEIPSPPVTNTVTDISKSLDMTAWISQYGTITGGGGVDGIDDQVGADVFNPSGISNWSDISSVLAALMLQYPDLWSNRIEFSPDGDATQVYIPVGFPTGGVGYQPTTDGATQTDLMPDITGDGDNATDDLIKTLIEMIQSPQTQAGMDDDTDTPVAPVNPNGDPRGIGENPPIVPPIGSASALWKIYNPSQSQLDTFGAWLWSSNFVDQLLKLFNDPMQAIIGLHKVYCTPPTSGSGPIKVGYLVSDASANYVSNQYTEIDCGDVDMKEHFNNAFDYDEFTRVSIFLPFIGFKDLDVKDIMRSTINVKYGVDVLTGACLAKITVTRDLNSPILYTFAGNCAVQYPVSSGSYIGIITGLCSLIGGVAGTLATGGALAPALVGATAGLPRMHTSVEHSGSISSNAGALGPKKPYIVIQRPQTHMPLNGILIEGKGQNESAVLGTLTGYVKVKKADLMGIPATGSELDEIRDLLEQGIYMS